VISKNVANLPKLRRWYRNYDKNTDTLKGDRQVKKISNSIIVKSSPSTDNSDMPTPY